MALVRLQNVGLTYGDNIVFDKIDAEIEAGDFICLVGVNGSGKTSLIKMMLGLMRPTRGKVIFEEMLANEVGYMPQESLIDQSFPASVNEVVLSGALNRKRLFCKYSQKDKMQARQKMADLGILDLASRSFKELSGGQRQKVLLARALMASIKLLILDEPSNNLDTKSRSELYAMLSYLNQKIGLSILMATHDLDHGNLIGDKVLLLKDKRATCYGKEAFIRRIHGDI